MRTTAARAMSPNAMFDTAVDSDVAADDADAFVFAVRNHTPSPRGGGRGSARMRRSMSSASVFILDVVKAPCRSKRVA